MTAPTRGRARRRRTRVLLLANLAALATAFVLGGWDMLQLHVGVGLPARTAPPMLLVAHRGDLDRYPEDTLEAITAAAEIGADGIEFDVHRSADGTWWVIHDPTLDETTNESGRIAAVGDDVIERAVIDGGFGFDPDVHAGIRVPRLEAVLEALADFDGRIYVDIQHAETGDAGEVARLIGDRAATVICRNLDDARAVKAVSPEIRTIARPDHADADPALDGWLIESFFEVTPSTIDRLGAPVTVFVDEWRSDDDETGMIRRAWALNVEAYLTKHPQAGLSIVRALADPSGSVLEHVDRPARHGLDKAVALTDEITDRVE